MRLLLAVQCRIAESHEKGMSIEVDIKFYIYTVTPMTSSIGNHDWSATADLKVGTVWPSLLSVILAAASRGYSWSRFAAHVG